MYTTIILTFTPWLGVSQFFFARHLRISPLVYVNHRLRSRNAFLMMFSCNTEQSRLFHYASTQRPSTAADFGPTAFCVQGYDKRSILVIDTRRKNVASWISQRGTYGTDVLHDSSQLLDTPSANWIRSAQFTVVSHALQVFATGWGSCSDQDSSRVVSDKLGAYWQAAKLIRLTPPALNQHDRTNCGFCAASAKATSM